MAWIVLLISAVFEAVWATALGHSAGFTRLAPVVIFFAGMLLSVSGLWWAMKSIPTGTAYAVWTGTGSALTVAIAMVQGVEPASVMRSIFLLGIVICVVSLSVLDDSDPAPKHTEQN